MGKVTYSGFLTALIGVVLYFIGLIFEAGESEVRPDLNFGVTSIFLIVAGAVIFIIGKIKDINEKKYLDENGQK